MKYIKQVGSTPHHKEVYEVHITRSDLETLDLLLVMYGPFLGSQLLLMDSTDQTLKLRLKRLRMGVNQIKKEIKEKI